MSAVATNVDNIVHSSAHKKTFFCSGGNLSDLKSSALERNLKEYEALQLEAARFERDAQRVNMENALLEQVHEP
jgi:hypothetical protein